jgi:hypothetical protein
MCIVHVYTDDFGAHARVCVCVRDCTLEWMRVSACGRGAGDGAKDVKDVKHVKDLVPMYRARVACAA